jgi:predicted ArsR family transcriptional regulator
MPTQSEQLWRLLSDKTRRELWRRILTSGDPLSSTQYAKERRLKVQNVAHHMKTLRDGGAVEQQKQHRGRGSIERFYGPTDRFDRGRVLSMIAELSGEQVA